VRNSCGRAIWAGIGSYLISPESTAEKINAARRLGADGFCIFSYNAVTEEGASDQYLKAVARLAGLKP
jgi:alkanesulfonate monooxygenase SsuD/methylene tetrahydromethanopterin reductase-like flavin-dependent oxidoreductase (luciferase family)